MRLRQKLEISPDQMAQMEAESHDVDYSQKTAGADSLTIDIDRYMKVHDQCYKPGTYIRGYRKRRLIQELQKLPLEDQRILDAGCGAATDGVFYACLGAKHVSGFDLSPVGIEAAKQRAEANGVTNRCDFQVANCTELPFDDESFDTVVCNAFVHHVIKYEGAAAELRRVLSPGGRMIIADGLRQNPLYRLGRFAFRTIRPAELDLGDVDLEKSDLFDFCSGMEITTREHFCGLEAIKYLIRGNYDVAFPATIMLRCAVTCDKAFLAVFPFLSHYMSEFILVAKKPG